MLHMLSVCDVIFSNPMCVLNEIMKIVLMFIALKITEIIRQGMGHYTDFTLRCARNKSFIQISSITPAQRTTSQIGILIYESKIFPPINFHWTVAMKSLSIIDVISFSLSLISFLLCPH